MHLAPKSQLYGLPARTIRDFLRRIAFAVFDQNYFRETLKIDDTTAKRAIASLLADGLIEFEGSGKGTAIYRIAPAGRQLAAARIGPQISRAVGERLLAAVIARAEDDQAQEPFAFYVSKVAVFGSMLGDAPLVSDVDIGLEIETLLDDEAYPDRCRERVEAAELGGKRFRTMLQSVVWPQVEMFEYLRGGERYVSVHRFNEMLQLKCPYRIVFDRTADDPAQGA